MKKSVSIFQFAIWMGILAIILLTGALDNKPMCFYTIMTIRTLLLAIFFNISYYVLMPLYFSGRKQAFFWLTLSAFLIYVAVAVAVDMSFDFPAKMMTTPNHHKHNPWLFRFIPTTSLGLIALSVAAWLSGFLAYESKKQEEEEANRQRLEAELALLKSQINPHFLLNTLNNLYAIALTSPEKTPDALLKLSEMMRYILHECQQPKIALDQDLQFIRNYIDLQSLRLPPNVTLTFSAPEPPIAGEIEPMILIPFIENAFKHGLTTKQPCSISISITTNKNNLILRVENSVLLKKTDEHKTVPGIGLANTRQRLAYSYPDKHNLVIENDGNIYKVELHLEVGT